MAGKSGEKVFSKSTIFIHFSWKNRTKTYIRCRRTGKNQEKIVFRWLPRNYIICRCRVSGTLALWGLSGYCCYLIKTKKPLSVVDKRFYVILGVTTALLGVYRGFIYYHGVFDKQEKNIDIHECSNCWLHPSLSHRVFHELHRHFPMH